MTRSPIFDDAGDAFLDERGKNCRFLRQTFAKLSKVLNEAEESTKLFDCARS